MEQDIRLAVSPREFAALMRAAGYRVTEMDRDGAVELHSASQVVGFAVRFHDPLPDADGLYLDITFNCLVRAEGGVPDGVTDGWNRTRRFARLIRHGEVLSLELNVLAAGGVTDAYLSTQVKLWDRLMQDFFLYVRQAVPRNEEPLAAAG